MKSRREEFIKQNGLKSKIKIEDVIFSKNGFYHKIIRVSKYHITFFNFEKSLKMSREKSLKKTGCERGKPGVLRSTQSAVFTSPGHKTGCKRRNTGFFY